ncbi:hypothetical protein CEXT_351271 [Caerostris extrusa]|uniref:Uncharacterized protein n=1 Tax=Caerostris extrusa TaxID=172846 RepID=A0AAV4UR38_CAEEX|nr:hypothetical protein CEXT_351271 [Caerostris extrusa]
MLKVFSANILTDMNSQEKSLKYRKEFPRRIRQLFGNAKKSHSVSSKEVCLEIPKFASQFCPQNNTVICEQAVPIRTNMWIEIVSLFYSRLSRACQKFSARRQLVNHPVFQLLFLSSSPGEEEKYRQTPGS